MHEKINQLSIFKFPNRVLVDPSLYAELISNPEVGNIFTYNSLSKNLNDNYFTYYIGFKKTYPEWLESAIGVPSFMFNGYKCIESNSLQTANKIYTIIIIKLQSNIVNDDYIDCK